MSADATTPFLRIEKGSASPDELVALTALLYARRHATSPAPPPVRAAAGWRRPERRPAFTDPRAWTSTRR